jgi:predicted acylesterase/phospholipase RssA/CRP-like cAMP-binding protein
VTESDFANVPLNDRQRLLAGRPVLRGMHADVLCELDAAMDVVRVPAGAPVVTRGQADTPFVLVVHGGLRVSYVDPEGNRRVLFEYFRGGTFGEAFVLSGRPSPFDAHAIRDSTLAYLRSDRLHELGARHPELLAGFARVLAIRMAELLGTQAFLESFSRRIDQLPRSIALVSSSSEGVRRTRNLVAEALARARNTRRVRLQDARHGEDRDDAELVVLEYEPSDPSWLDFCARSVDRVMILLDEKDLGQLRTGPDWLRRIRSEDRSISVSWAIVHDPWLALPHGGDAYSQIPETSRLHHVRSGVPRDAEQLARWLLDRPVGLVLGGGGARGIAHVGVLKALEEARVPVDIVGGTSMGAIFAGGHARGWTADKIMDEVRHLFRSRLALYDPTIPMSALLAGRKLDRELATLFDDIEIADLWTPFFCVSTNISHALREVHESGRLRDAIRSSCAIPGLFPPFEKITKVLVDGGLIDNLPIDVMAERSRGPVIAVDVFPYRRPADEASSHHPLQRLTGLLRWLKPFSQPGPPEAPRLFDTLMRSTLVGSQHATELSLSRHPPALHLVPDIVNRKLLNWGDYESLFRAGYECAKDALDAGKLPSALWEGRIENA